MKAPSEQLLEKYNIPVPRYTSYPPANYFEAAFPREDYERGLEASNRWLPQNISLYIHIPFCRKRCFYCGCNACLSKGEEMINRYMESLQKEISRVSRYLDRQNRRVSQIHFGGGTPNSIPVRHLEAINRLIYQTFGFIDEPEIAIECHPAYLDKEYLDALNEMGFNRYSLGIQDFNETVLKTINREGPAMPVQDILSYIRKLRTGNSINLDFIYGLPGQTIEGFAQTMQQAVQLKPERLVTFSYAHVPWVNKAQEKLEQAGLPGHDTKIGMFWNTYELMIRNNYRVIGMDHYALEDDELSLALSNKTLHRNFQGYCTRRTTGQVYAFGVSGISQLERMYAQNTKSVDHYIQSLNRDELPIVKGYRLNDNELVLRDLITDFMCNKRLNWKAFAGKYDMTVQQLKAVTAFDENTFEAFRQDGMIRFSGDEIQLADQGELFIRNIAAALDPLLQNQTGNFSKPV